MQWRHVPMAVAAGVAAGSVMVSGPAAARETTSAPPTAGWSRPEAYLDRPSVQRFAAAVRRWDHSSDLPVTAAATGCLRLPNPVAAGVCAAAFTLFGAYTLDRLEQADLRGACLRFSLGWSGPSIDVDDGPRCHGSRSSGKG